MTSLGRELKVARIIAGLNQFEAAKAAGTNFSVLSAIENNHLIPSPDLEMRLKRATYWTPLIAQAIEASDALRAKMETETEKISAAIASTISEFR